MKGNHQQKQKPEKEKQLQRMFHEFVEVKKLVIDEQKSNCGASADCKFCRVLQADLPMQQDNWAYSSIEDQLEKQTKNEYSIGCIHTIRIN